MATNDASAPEASSNQHRPIAISLGDPAGIGPEIICKAIQAWQGKAPNANLVGTRTAANSADRRNLQVHAPKLWFETFAQSQDLFTQATPNFASLGVEVIDLPMHVSQSNDLCIGKVSQQAGEWAYQSIVSATQAVLKGEARALCTAPINKEAMQLAGHAYPGHTELLAELAGGVPVRMMLANHELRSVLVSIHLSLREALDQVSQAGVFETLRITHKSLQSFGIAHPRLAVAGLNPHAGENGIFGREEIDIIAPAIQQARAQGIDAQGPFPPDTVFMQARGFAKYDAVIAMYHDQGLIPVKYIGVEQGVNVTLGLPFVRTSPDHGTAFDIAGKGQADASSMLAALNMADELSA